MIICDSWTSKILRVLTDDYFSPCSFDFWNRKKSDLIQSDDSNHSSIVMSYGVRHLGQHWFRQWWRHQMEAFSASLAICAGNSPVPGEFPAQRPVTWSFDVFFDLRLIKPLSKQRWGSWFQTLSRPLWRHCNAMACRLIKGNANLLTTGLLGTYCSGNWN